MSRSRFSLLRNRKTAESFNVEPNHRLVPLRKQGLFRKTEDVSHVEQELQNFVSTLPNTLSAQDKETILLKLRQEYIGKHKDINTIITQPELLTTLVNSCSDSANHANHQEPLTTMAFLKLLANQLVNAKLNMLLPGLSFLASQMTAVSAEGYEYHEGQPRGGVDLCVEKLYGCIQGYVTEMGQLWNKDLPQVARTVETATARADQCVTQDGLKAMIDRAYRGPKEAMNCHLTADTLHGGRLSVNATAVDPITCNIMKDSLVGLTQNCPKDVGYEYHEGQPRGGIDLCVENLSGCIQGYVTEMGQLWNKDLPQVVRTVETATARADQCVTQDDLKAMIDHAYRGPNDEAMGCHLTADTLHGGRLSVNATAVDPITCNIMKDSLVGLTQDCPKDVPKDVPHSFFGNKTFDLAAASVGGIGLLALLGFALYKYLDNRHKQSLLLSDQDTSTRYQTMYLP